MNTEFPQNATVTMLEQSPESVSQTWTVWLPPPFRLVLRVFEPSSVVVPT